MFTAHTRQIITLFCPSLFFLCICLTVFYHGFEICFVIFFLLLLVLLYARLHEVVDHQLSFIMNILLELSICIFLASIDRQFELQSHFTNLFAFDSLLFRLVFFSHKTKLTRKHIQFTCSFHLFCQRKGDKQKPSSFFPLIFCSFCCYASHLACIECFIVRGHWWFCPFVWKFLSDFLSCVDRTTNRSHDKLPFKRTNSFFSFSVFNEREKI